MQMTNYESISALGKIEVEWNSRFPLKTRAKYLEINMRMESW